MIRVDIPDLEGDNIQPSGEPESNRKLRMVAETASDAFVGMDGYGRITDWNHQAEATFGWRHQEVVGRGLADTIIPPQYREAHRVGLARFLATGEAHIVNQHIEITAIDRHGREFPVELAVRAVDEGTDTVRFQAFVRDISERRAHQDALRESEAKHHRLADQLAAAQQTAGIGSWEWDIPANTVSWSDELYRIFGVDPTTFSATYQGYLDHVHPEDREGADSAIRATFETLEEFAFGGPGR
jgi:PAS domain S-box-containing protein